jgi:hypothetical protein
MKSEIKETDPPLNEWVKIGNVGVDAGLMMIGDPYYVTGDEPTNSLISDWDKLCSHVFEEKNQIHGQVACDVPFAMGHSGAAVITSTGFGDGCYDVFAKFIDEDDWGIRIKEVKVIFIEDDDET